MGRKFQANIDIAAGTTQLDIVEVVAATGIPILIHEVVLTTDIETDANEAQIELRIARFTGAFTSGSGGATVNAYYLGGGGATEDSATVEVGNSTQITGGTTQILGHAWMNNRVGWHYLPTPEARPTVNATDAFAVQLQAALAANTAFGGHIVFEELVQI